MSDPTNNVEAAKVALTESSERLQKAQQAHQEASAAYIEALGAFYDESVGQ